jgi:hypothetical protein
MRVKGEVSRVRMRGGSGIGDCTLARGAAARSSTYTPSYTSSHTSTSSPSVSPVLSLCLSLPIPLSPTLNLDHP